MVKVLSIHTEDARIHEVVFTILGFHPCREIVFVVAWSRGVACHLKSSKLEDLGNMYSKDDTLIIPSCVTWMENAFPYCIGNLKENSQLHIFSYFPIYEE